MVDWDSQLFKNQESSGYIGPAKNKTVDDLEYVMGRVGHTSLDTKHSKGEKSSEELPPLIEAITRSLNVSVFFMLTFCLFSGSKCIHLFMFQLVLYASICF